jgi:hypothetical protein
MAKSSYQFQKRQKELERKKKNEEKLLRKREKPLDEAVATDGDSAEQPAPEEDQQ